jgi:hypothetical protein
MSVKKVKGNEQGNRFFKWVVALWEQEKEKSLIANQLGEKR